MYPHTAFRTVLENANSVIRSHKMKEIVVCVLLFLVATARSDASPASDINNQLKILMRRYEQVEAQFDRSFRYSKKEVSGEETTIEQALFNGAGDPRLSCQT